MNLKTPESFLSMLMNVPFLPPELFPEAKKILKKEMDKIKSIDKNVIIYFDYFCDEWLSNPEQVSVFNAITDTNDGPESFHRHINSVIVEKHPGIWTLIGKK